MSIRHVAILTPCYGGLVTARYMVSVIAFQQAAAARGITVDLHMKSDSLVQRVRNALTHEALKSDADAFFWIDGDIGFPADLALRMLALDLPVVAAPYAKKQYDWSAIAAAAKMGDPELTTAGTDPVWNTWPGQKLAPASDGTASIYDIGTGFLLTKRFVYEEMALRMPETLHLSPPFKDADGQTRREPCFAFWDCQIDAGGNYLSEDWLFCRRVQAMGVDVRVLPAAGLVHEGPHPFRCDPERFLEAA